MLQLWLFTKTSPGCQLAKTQVVKFIGLPTWFEVEAHNLSR